MVRGARDEPALWLQNEIGSVRGKAQALSRKSNVAANIRRSSTWGSLRSPDAVDRDVFSPEMPARKPALPQL